MRAAPISGFFRPATVASSSGAIWLMSDPTDDPDDGSEAIAGGAICARPAIGAAVGSPGCDMGRFSAGSGAGAGLLSGTSSPLARRLANGGKGSGI
ncbi:MAG TPA: hypothetical protein VF175_14140 [Lacipirellula sp.]